MKYGWKGMPKEVLYFLASEVFEERKWNYSYIPWAVKDFSISDFILYVTIVGPSGSNI